VTFFLPDILDFFDADLGFAGSDPVDAFYGGGDDGS